MNNNNVLNVSGLHNPDINSKDCKFCVYNWENGCPSDQSSCWICKDKSEFKRKKVIFDRCKPKQGYLSKVRVRIDDGKQIHYLGNVDCLVNYFSIETCLSLLNGFSQSGLDCYTRHMRSGLKVEIFEI